MTARVVTTAFRLDVFVVRGTAVQCGDRMMVV
jgi:hypothetical protein